MSVFGGVSFCHCCRKFAWGAGKVGQGGFLEVQRLETMQMEVGVTSLVPVIDIFTNIILISDCYYS